MKQVELTEKERETLRTALEVYVLFVSETDRLLKEGVPSPVVVCVRTEIEVKDGGKEVLGELLRVEELKARLR